MVIVFIIVATQFIKYQDRMEKINNQYIKGETHKLKSIPNPN